MTMNLQTVPGGRNSVPEGWLWFGACAGAAAFALDGFVNFLICTQACQDGTGDLGVLSAGAVRMTLGGITVFFMALTVWGGIVSFRNWQRLSENRKLARAEGHGRQDFMALIGIFTSVVFLVGIIWAGLPLIFMSVCVTPR